MDMTAARIPDIQKGLGARCLIVQHIFICIFHYKHYVTSEIDLVCVGLHIVTDFLNSKQGSFVNNKRSILTNKDVTYNGGCSSIATRESVNQIGKDSASL